MQRNPILLTASLGAAVIALVACASCTTSRPNAGEHSSSAAPAGAAGAAPISGQFTLQNLRAQVDASTLAMLPSGRGSNKLFDRYRLDGEARWADNWTRAIDMSGVSWDSPRTVTLVSPRHVVMAKHYQRPGQSSIMFHDRNGTLHVRTLISITPVPGTDIAVGGLDRDVPVKFYKVLAPRVDYQAWLRGALAIVSDQDAKLFVHRIAAIQGGVVRFSRPDEVHRSYRTELITGDSGNPSFVLVRGDPVLIETHTLGGPGAGPFVSHPAVFSQINAIMQRLPGGYQLTTVDLDVQAKPSPTTGAQIEAAPERYQTPIDLGREISDTH